MKPTKKVFLINDIVIKDFKYDNPERYEFTKNIPNFLDFVQNYSKTATEDEKKTAESFSQTFPASLGDIKTWTQKKGGHDHLIEEWEHGATYDEIYEIPMMNTLRYFPFFVQFTEEDRYKTVGNTTLLYDTDEEEGGWAVGMTGGGMDLSPDLLATFINLEKGVPLELARNINRDYSAYINKETHEANCDLLAQAFLDYGNTMLNCAIRLNPAFEKDRTLQRHIKGLQKTSADTLKHIKN